MFANRSRIEILRRKFWRAAQSTISIVRMRAREICADYAEIAFLKNVQVMS